MKVLPLREAISARALALGVNLNDKHLTQLELYCELLERWNRTINLTSLPLSPIEDRTIDRLILEPWLAAVEVPEGPVDWVDLGSGGGSPAIPLKIVRPSAKLLMVESRERKAAFLREAVRRLELESASVVTVRIEDLEREGSIESRDLVTIRAVKPSAALAEQIVRVLKPGGRFLVFGNEVAEGTNSRLSIARSVRLQTGGILSVLEKKR